MTHIAWSQALMRSVNSRSQDSTVTEDANVTPQERARAASHQELVDDAYRKPESTRATSSSDGPPHAHLSDLENVIRQYGGDNGRRLTQLADLVQNDGGVPGEVTEEDLDKALAGSNLSSADRRAVKYMRTNIAEISHENDVMGGSMNWLSYLRSRLDLAGSFDDSISLNDLSSFAAQRGVTHEGVALAAARDYPRYENSYYPHRYGNPIGSDSHQIAMQSDAVGGNTIDANANASSKQNEEMRIQCGTREYAMAGNGDLKYTVAKGDSVARVATELLSSCSETPPSPAVINDYIKQVIAANQLDKGGRRADVIFPGETLRFPPPDSLK